MVEFGFYHLQRTALEPALGRLLERVLASGQRAVVRAGSPERVEALTRALWTFGRDSFLPHGSRADGHAEDQPVFLTDEADYPNAATVLVLVDGVEVEPPAQFGRCLYLFDGNDHAGGRARPGALAQVARAGREPDLLAAGRARLAAGDGDRDRRRLRLRALSRPARAGYKPRGPNWRNPRHGHRAHALDHQARRHPAQPDRPDQRPPGGRGAADRRPAPAAADPRPGRGVLCGPQGAAILHVALRLHDLGPGGRAGARRRERGRPATGR